MFLPCRLWEWENADVLDIHDFIVQDYGPNRTIASVHVEGDAKADILGSHDLIENIEKEIHDAYQVNLTIHLDPVAKDHPVGDKRHQLTLRVLTSA